jgi:hypothetical protein
MCPFSQIYGQARFRDHGVAGLWRDKARPSRIPLLSPEVAEPVVALTRANRRPAASHWTGSAMAKAAGISVSSVQRIWRARGLRPPSRHSVPFPPGS